MAPTRRRVLSRTALGLAAALVLAGCGGSDEARSTASAPEGSSASTAVVASGEPTRTQTHSGTEGTVGTTATGLTDADELAVADTLRSWLLSGGCDLMSDAFLRDQTLAHEGTREQRCSYFETIFTTPALTAADIIVKDVTGTPRRATAVVTDDFSGIEATYTLVNTGDGWLIDAWNF
jgi:hypothetical protein